MAMLAPSREQHAHRTANAAIAAGDQRCLAFEASRAREMWLELRLRYHLQFATRLAILLRQGLAALRLTLKHAKTSSLAAH